MTETRPGLRWAGTSEDADEDLNSEKDRTGCGPGPSTLSAERVCVHKRQEQGESC